MKPADDLHSNIILVIAVGTMLGLIIYLGIYWLGGWRVLIATFGIALLVWCGLIALEKWPR